MTILGDEDYGTVLQQPSLVKKGKRWERRGPDKKQKPRRVQVLVPLVLWDESIRICGCLWCFEMKVLWFERPACAPLLSPVSFSAWGRLTRTVPSPYSLLWCRNSRWSRREEADFYRTVSTFGVEFDRESGRFKWDRFRSLARLERKYDETITEYFHAFYYMCQTVCGKFRSDDRGKWLCLGLCHMIRKFATWWGVSCQCWRMWSKLPVSDDVSCEVYFSVRWCEVSCLCQMMSLWGKSFSQRMWNVTVRWCEVNFSVRWYEVHFLIRWCEVCFLIKWCEVIKTRI